MLDALAGDSTLYTRHPEVLRAVFALTPEYLRGDAAGDDAGAAIDYMDYGIQLGRRFRALQAWMVLCAFGRSGIESRIREHCRLAGLLARQVAREPGFELAAPSSMSVVCFRCADDARDVEETDRLNQAIVEAVNASGRAYLTHTRLLGRTVLDIPWRPLPGLLAAGAVLTMLLVATVGVLASADVLRKKPLATLRAE